MLTQPTNTPVPLCLPWGFYALGCLMFANALSSFFDRSILGFCVGLVFAFLSYKVFQLSDGAFKARRLTP